MTAFLALVRKDLILYLSDRRALLLNLAMPIVLAAFFGFLFGGAGAGQQGKIEVALVQQDFSAAGKKIADGLKADPALTVVELDLDQATREVRKGKQKVAVVIPPGFGEAAGAALFGAAGKPEIGVLYDPSQSALPSMVKGMLTQHVMQVVSTDMLSGAGGAKFTADSLRQLEQRGAQDADSVALKELLGSMQKYQQRPPAAGGSAPAAGMSVPFATRDQAITSGAADAGYNAYAHAFAGMGVQFVLFMGIEVGVGILLARRAGVWSRLLAAPVSLNTVLLARAASGALIAFCLMLLIFLFAVAVFRVEIANPAGFVAVCAAFALMTAAFGLLIAAFGKTPEAARGLAIFATLVMVMLGGAWVPSFIFPAWLQSATLVMPTRWAVDGLDAMTWRGLGMDAAWPAVAVQLGFALLFAGLALWRFKEK